MKQITLKLGQKRVCCTNQLQMRDRAGSTTQAGGKAWSAPSPPPGPLVLLQSHGAKCLPLRATLGKRVVAKFTVCQIWSEALHTCLLLTTKIYIHMQEVGIILTLVDMKTEAYIEFASSVQHHRANQLGSIPTVFYSLNYLLKHHANYLLGHMV